MINYIVKLIGEGIADCRRESETYSDAIEAGTD